MSKSTIEEFRKSWFHVASGGKDVFKTGTIAFQGRDGVSFQIANLEFDCVFVEDASAVIQVELQPIDSRRARLEFKNFLLEGNYAAVNPLLLGHLGQRKLYARFFSRYIKDVDAACLDYTFYLGEVANA